MQVRVEESTIPFFEVLASPVRMKVIHYLSQKDANIKELAEKIGVSSAVMTSHIQKLEEVGIVKSNRTSVGKLCSLLNTNFTLEFPQYSIDSQYNYETSVGVGHYTAAEVLPTCGIADQHQVIYSYDDPRSFFDSRRVDAQLIWFVRGYVEYTIPNYVTFPQKMMSLEITAELSSEYPHYRDDWPSDIALFLNGEPVCTWTSPGDYGMRRGKLTPAWWTSNQYGLLKSFKITGGGVFIDEEQVSKKTLRDFPIDTKLLVLRFAVVEKDGYAGGLSIYGKQFGNFAQDIGVRIGYNV